MVLSRWVVAILGILLPYLARIPGTVTRGPEWLGSFFGGQGLVNAILVVLFLGAFNGLVWGSVVLFSFLYRHPLSLWISAVISFPFPLYAYARIDLASDAQAGIGLIFIPICSMVFVALGGAVAFAIDRLVLARRTGE